jgi:hypothetical protein
MRAHQDRSYGPSVTTDKRTIKPTSEASATRQACVSQYEIRVNGRLDSRWTAWFEGLSLTTEDDGTTVIRGPVVDQAALHGLLHKLRDIGIPIVSLARLPSEAPAELSNPGDHPVPYDPSGATS